ncbi:helix-turn-helix domain-containing protein [Sphingomonas sp. DT-207]|uniref:helix-turn-helix domain-containing protein n=1 Tax=Sphingomonas sp. DT-207 TaxID=3396167 RepID=UPI003F1CA9F4
MVITPSGDRWDRVPVTCIEDLKDAVLGAGLEATQLSAGGMNGSLLFAASDDITYSSGHIGGQVTLSGPLSEERVTLGLGIYLGPGSRQWLGEVSTGAIGVFRPGDPHNGFYTPGSIYLCATLSFDRLEEIAAEMDLVLDPRQLGGSGVAVNKVHGNSLAAAGREFRRLHRAGRSPGLSSVAGRDALESMIAALARAPRAPGGRELRGYGRIVARAQEYILAHLEGPLTIRAIARAAFASQSTLYRAFGEVLSETPQSFVRKLRLNRIRRDLATEKEVLCTVTVIANRWGIAELGRFAGWYRELFDELPSQTRARCIAALRDVAAAGAPRHALVPQAA